MIREYFEMCRCDAITLLDVTAVLPECMLVTSSLRDEYNEGNLNGNIATAAFTRCYVRMNLLNMME